MYAIVVLIEVVRIVEESVCSLRHICVSIYAVQVDTKLRDQVSFPDVLFGFCYFAHSDSPYFNFASLSFFQEKMKSREHGCSCIIVEDLNARFGETMSFQTPLVLP